MWLLICFINSSLEANTLGHSPHWKVFLGIDTFFSTVIMEESLLSGSGRLEVVWETSFGCGTGLDSFDLVSSCWAAFGFFNIG